MPPKPGCRASFTSGNKLPIRIIRPHRTGKGPDILHFSDSFGIAFNHIAGLVERGGYPVNAKKVRELLVRVATAELVEAILASRPHPQQGFRACLGILRLGKSFGDQRLEAAARRALHIGARSYRSVHSIP